MLFAADAVGEMHENGKGPRTELPAKTTVPT